MIIESKVVEDNRSRSIHVSRRGSSILEKWVFVELSPENYQISFYEKFKDSGDEDHTLVSAYSRTPNHQQLTPQISLEEVPLPDDLVVEIARIRRKIGS